MPKLSIAKGKTSYLARIFIQDSSSTTGAGLSGLTSGSAGLVCYRARDDDGNAGATQITLSAGTRGTWSSGGFVEKDATNQKGVYEFGIPNAALASGSNSVLIYFSGATNMAPLPLEIELTGWDNQDAVHGGMSCLPNTAVTTNASLITSGSGTDQLSVTSGRGKADTVFWNASAVATPITSGVPVVDWTPSPAELTGTATASASGSITLASSASATANFYSGMVILITSGTGKGQARLISGYTTGRVASVTPAWTTTPAATATYIVYPFGPAELEGLLFGNSSSGAAVTNATAGILDVNTKNYNNQAAQTDSNNLPKVDAEDWKGGVIAAVNVTGVPKVDLVDISGSAVSTSSAQLGVNVVQMNAVSTSSVTTINANQGTTQPLNFTGTAASALVKGDTIDWNSTAVAAPATAGIPEVNVKNINNVSAAAVTTVKAVQGLTTADTIATVSTGGLVDLTSTTYAESSAVPAATATLKDKIIWLATLARNKITQTSTTTLLRNDADNATVGTSTVSDDGTTFTRGKFS